jgi:hypothetical protein
MSGAPADRMGGQRAEVRDRSTAHSTAAAAGSGTEGRAAEAFEQADSLAKARALKSVDRRECSLEPFALLLHLLLLHMLGLQRRTRDEHSSVSMPGIPNGTALDGEESERWGATDKALRGCARSSWQLTCIAPAIARGLDSSGKPRQVLAAAGLRASVLEPRLALEPTAIAPAPTDLDPPPPRLPGSRVCPVRG